MATLLDAVHHAATEVLLPAAERTDRATVVPAENLDALRAAGAFSVYGPERAPAADIRRVHRTLGAACGATYFIWAQHQGPSMLLGLAADQRLREEWEPRLSSGEVIGGTAFAHLRRPGPPAVAASPVAGGWRLRGRAPWATSWGIAGVYSLAAITDAGTVLWSLVEGVAQPGLTTEPLDLAVMASTSTVELVFDDLFVPDERVLVEMDAAAWGDIDDSISVRLNPAALGVADRALALLAERPDEQAVALAAHLKDELDECAAENERLALAADGGEVDGGALSAGRAWGLDLALRAADALLLAVGGRGMDLRHPAQRLVREAAFYGIQGQAAAGRRASLSRLLG